MNLSDIALSSVVTYGNSKLPKTTAIFNIASATDCVNRGTARCQVDAEECYAYKTEQRWSNTLRFRRRQGDFWDVMDARSFIEQFNNIRKCKRNVVTKLRFNVSGDIRNRRDAEKIDAIARSLDIPVYLYTASSHVDFSGINHAMIQCSNEKLWQKYGQKSNFGRYKVVENAENVEQDWNRCPNNCSGCNLCSTASKVIQELH